MAIPDGLIGLPQLSAKPSAPDVGAVFLYTRTDGVLYLQDSTGTEFAFGSVDFISQLTGDVSAIGPGSAAAVVNSVGGQTAAAIATATVAYGSATPSNTPSTLVLRDPSGNFSANVITASLNGNAATATTAASSVNFSGSLSGDVTGTQSATVVSFVGGQTATAVAFAATQVAAATSLNIASTLVIRDASGNFAANIVTAALNGNATTATNATTAVNFSGSLFGDVTGTQSATAISSTVVTGKLLTGYGAGTNTPIIATNSILTAFENIQAQITAFTGAAITQLTGDVSSIGPGSVAATIEAIQGNTVSGTTGTTNVVFSNAPTLTGLLTGDSASFSSTITASNFSGSSSGSNTGDVTLTNTNSIDLAFASGQSGLNATLNLSAAVADVNNVKATYSIKSDGLFIEVPFGTPVNIGTTNMSGAASSFSLTDHVHAITSSVVLGLLLTGYTAGTNTPITATNSILTAFENLQAQISSSVGSAITSLTGDVTATGPGAASATVTALQGHSVSNTAPTDAQILIWVNGTSKWTPSSISGDATIADSGTLTLTTVNSNVGSFGSSTAIPTFTVNAKGLITAASTAVVVAPAGTLTGTTLASNVVNSSLTSVGTIVTGVWNGTALTAPYMLALPTNEIYVGNVSNQPTAVVMSGDVSIVSSGATTISSTTVTGKLLTGYVVGTNTPLIATNSILTAFENIQAQINTTVGAAVTSLTGDVTGTGPGATTTTIAKIQGTAVSGTTGTGNVVFSNSPALVTPSLGAATSTSLVVSGLTASQAVFTNGSSQLVSNTITGTGNVVMSASPTLTGTITAAAVTFSAAITSTFSSVDALILNTTSFIFDTVNNALGIGTQPSTSVMIDGVNTSAASKLVQMTGYGVGSTTGYRGRFARGTLGTPSAVQSGDTLSAISGRGYGASQFAAASTGVINIVAGETFTNTSNLTYLQFSTTPTGSVTSAEAMRVASTGVTLGPQTASTAVHQINGGVQQTVRVVTAGFTIDTTTSDFIIMCNHSAAISITLPPPVLGRIIKIKDISGLANTNNITIVRHATENIEGLAASKILQTNFGAWTFTTDGTNWFML